MNASVSAMNEPCKDQENIDPNVQQTNDLLNAAQLKKKEVPQSNKTRRTKTWLDKPHKGKRKPTKSVASTKKGTKQQKKDDGVQPHVEVEKNGNNKGSTEDCEGEGYNVIGSFTQLLTAPLSTCDDEDLFLHLQVS